MDEWGVSALRAIVRRLSAEQDSTLLPLLPVTFALHPDSDFARPPGYQIELRSGERGGVLSDSLAPTNVRGMERRLAISLTALRAVTLEHGNPQALMQRGDLRVFGSSAAYPIWNSFFDASARTAHEEMNRSM